MGQGGWAGDEVSTWEPERQRSRWPMAREGQEGPTYSLFHTAFSIPKLDFFTHWPGCEVTYAHFERASWVSCIKEQRDATAPPVTQPGVFRELLCAHNTPPFNGVQAGRMAERLPARWPWQKETVSSLKSTLLRSKLWSILQ